MPLILHHLPLYHHLLLQQQVAPGPVHLLKICSNDWNFVTFVKISQVVPPFRLKSRPTESSFWPVRLFLHIYTLYSYPHICRQLGFGCLMKWKTTIIIAICCPLCSFQPILQFIGIGYPCVSSKAIDSRLLSNGRDMTIDSLVTCSSSCFDFIIYDRIRLWRS